jgi:hypothetical protein
MSNKITRRVKENSRIDLTSGWTHEMIISEPWVEIEFLMDPSKCSTRDKFILSSTDDSYRKELTVKDDKIDGDNKITLHFTKVKPGLLYNLEYIPENESIGFMIFENAPYEDIVE